MKKFAKILVLLLSVALAVGAVAMAVSADSKTEAFGKDITAELSAAGSYVLSEDSCLSATVALTADLAIDLNGYSLSANCDMFKVDSGVNLTITGEGYIYLFGSKLVDSAAPDDTEGLNVTVQGTKGKGINVEHTGKSAVIVNATVGNYTFDHTKIVSTAKSSAASSFFNNGSNPVGATWTFNYVDFYSETPLTPASAASKETPDSPVSVVEVCGTAGKAFFNYSTVKAGANIVGIVNAATPAHETVVSVKNSTLAAVSVPGFRCVTFSGGWKGTASGKIVADKSTLTGGYAIVTTAANDPGNNAGYVDNVSIYATDCVIRHTGMTSNSENGCISGCPNVYTFGDTYIFTVSKVVATRNGKFIPTVGTRINYDPTADTSAIDASGAPLNESTSLKVVLDPSNTAAPYVIASPDAEDIIPVADQFGFQNFENNSEKPNDAAIKENAANGTNFVATSKVVDGLLSTTEVKSIEKAGSLTTGWMTSMWWNLSGNFGVDKTATNNYMRYYVPGEVGTTVDMKANNASPVFDLAPSGAQRDVANTKVAVYTFDIATDTGRYVDASVSIHMRNTSGATGNAISISGSKSTVTFPVEVNGNKVTRPLPTDGSWVSFTAVVYFDNTAEFSKYGANAGAVYWYMNGELVCMVNGIGNKSSAATTIHGLRFDVSGQQTAGASVLLDNWFAAYYEKYTQEGEGTTTAKHKPDVYAKYVGNYGTTVAPPAISLENQSYYDVDEAIKKANNSNFDLFLNANATAKVAVESKLMIWSNGYTLKTLDGSTSVSAVYDENGNIIAYVFDPANDVYKVKYAYFKGDFNDLEQLMSDEYYDIYEFVMGQSPNAAFTFTDPLYSRKEGQTIYLKTQIAWGDNYGVLGEVNRDGSLVTADEPITLTEDFCKKYSGKTIYKFPVFTESELAKSAGNFLVFAKDGTLRHKQNITAAIWNSGTREWKLGDGETVILYGNGVKLAGSIDLTGAYAADGTRSFNFDLNGYAITLDGTGGGSDAATLFTMAKGDKVNFYSSVPGGLVDMRGVRSNTAKLASSGYVFSILGGQSVGNNEAPNAEKLDAIKNDAFFELNVGACNDLDGNKVAPSNLTFYTESLFMVYAGSTNSSVNVDGINFVRNGSKGAPAFFNTEVFYGSINVSNTEIVSLHDGATVADNGNQFATNGATNYTFNNVTVVTADATASFFGSAKGIASVSFTDCSIASTVAAPENCTVTAGVGNYFYAVNAEGIAIPEGCVVIPCYQLATLGTYTFKKVTATPAPDATNSNGSINYMYTFSLTDVKFAPAGETADYVLPALSYKVVNADDAKQVTVTFVDFAGNVIKADTYYVGEKVVAPEGVEMDAIVVDPITFVFGGEWENLPELATEDVTVTPKKVGLITLDRTTLLQNLTLHSDFGVNLFIPVTDAYTVKSVVAGGKTLDLTKIVTVNGVQYVKVTADRNVTEIGYTVEFTVTVTVGDIEATDVVEISVMDYAQYIIAANYSNETKDLMKYIIKYVKAANDYAEITNEYVDSISDAITVDGYEKNYTALDADLGAVFSAAYVDLEGTAPVYRFAVAEGAQGTITVNGVEYDLTTCTEIVIDDLRAYEFLDGVTIVVGETTATFTLANYAAWAQENKTEVMAIVNALYDYCTAAAAYVASK